MARGIALINGRNYAHQDIVLNIGGVPMVSLSNFSTTKRKVREFSYGGQELPVGYGDGRKEPIEITFEISKTEAEALESASPNNDMTDLPPFDIPLTGTNPALPKLKILKNILIQELSETTDVDTTDIKATVTAICSHIVTLT